MDYTRRRDHQIALMEKDETIRRLEEVLQNWRCLKNEERVREIEFKLAILRKTRAEQFLSRTRLADRVEQEWQAQKRKR